MSNQIPFSGATQVAGGYLLPPAQGEILVNGILVETGVIQLAGDARSTSSRKTNFPIWLGRPTAGPVSEGAAKGVTGASFGQATLNVQKFASIILFTDEQIEDLQNGDLNVLADAGVRQALSVSIDAHGAGLSAGQPITTVFDSSLASAAAFTPGVVVDTTAADGVQKGVSAAMGILELNGYGNPDDLGVLLGFGTQQQLRDARDLNNRPLYDGGTYAGQSIDPLYGLARAHSTNLASTAQDNTASVTTVNTSNSVTVNSSPNSNVALVVGAPISGTGIPANSFIGAVTGTAFPYTITTVAADGTTAKNATASATVTATVRQPIGYVAHRPNVHVRVREDIIVKTSNEATVHSGGTTFDLFQMNLTALLYETRLGVLLHDAARSVVPLYR